MKFLMTCCQILESSMTCESNSLLTPDLNELVNFVIEKSFKYQNTYPHILYAFDNHALSVNACQLKWCIAVYVSQVLVVNTVFVIYGSQRLVKKEF